MRVRAASRLLTDGPWAETTESLIGYYLVDVDDLDEALRWAAMMRNQLMVVAVIHLVPVVGVLGAERLAGLYGVRVDQPDLEILLRHRAMLFGLLGASLAAAALVPDLHATALAAAAVAVGSFLVLAVVGQPGGEVARVVAVDVAAFVVLLVGAAAHVMDRYGS